VSRDLFDWEKAARDLQLQLHTAMDEAQKFRGMSSPYGFGPIREASTLAKVAALADEAFGIHPSHPAFDASQEEKA
jgi:hypothetical protein